MSTLTDPLSIEYLEWCRSEGTPATTIRRRESTLRSVGNAGVATREDLEAWWTSRSDKQPATRASDLANLRTFYRWCVLWEHRAADDDPKPSAGRAHATRSPRTGKPGAAPLTPQPTRPPEGGRSNR